VVRLGPQHLKNGRIRIERTHGSADVDIPVSHELQAACDAMPKAHLTYIVTAHGKPRSKYGLGNDFAKWATEAGLPARCRLHGLKKSGLRRLAEDGNTTHELMAISGHKTLSEVQRYTDAVDRKRLAESGMAKRQAAQKKNAGVANLNEPLLRPDRPMRAVLFNLVVGPIVMTLALGQFDVGDSFSRIVLAQCRDSGLANRALSH
jgi:hypothetical protein